MTKSGEYDFTVAFGHADNFPVEAFPAFVQSKRDDGFCRLIARR